MTTSVYLTPLNNFWYNGCIVHSRSGIPMTYSRILCLPRRTLMLLLLILTCIRLFLIYHLHMSSLLTINVAIYSFILQKKILFKHHSMHRLRSNISINAIRIFITKHKTETSSSLLKIFFFFFFENEEMGKNYSFNWIKFLSYYMTQDVLRFMPMLVNRRQWIDTHLRSSYKICNDDVLVVQ